MCDQNRKIDRYIRTYLLIALKRECEQRRVRKGEGDSVDITFHFSLNIRKMIYSLLFTHIFIFIM